MQLWTITKPRGHTSVSFGFFIKRVHTTTGIRSEIAVIRSGKILAVQRFAAHVQRGCSEVDSNWSEGTKLSFFYASQARRGICICVRISAGGVVDSYLPLRLAARTNRPSLRRDLSTKPRLPLRTAFIAPEGIPLRLITEDKRGVSSAPQHHW